MNPSFSRFTVTGIALLTAAVLAIHQGGRGAVVPTAHAQSTAITATTSVLKPISVHRRTFVGSVLSTPVPAALASSPLFAASPAQENRPMPIVALEGAEAVVAALYPQLDGPRSSDFDDQGRLTDDGKAARCPLATSALSAWERGADADVCGVENMQAAGWVDALYERGCIDDAAWASFYQRLHARRLNATYAFGAATAGTTVAAQCGQDFWADADLSERHACEALSRQDGMSVAGGVCKDASEISDASDLLTP